MDLTTITTSDFKTHFFRDFPYLNEWDETEPYNTDDQVYYSVNGLFYKALSDGVTSIPTNTGDWERVTDSINNYILDADITKAFSEAQFNFNQSLFGSDDNIQIGYLYLTAHFLVLDIRRSGQGTYRRSPSHAPGRWRRL